MLTNHALALPAIEIRNAAVRALLGELITYPKPGLVSLVDCGSHADMDSTTFMRSTLSLRRYFFDMAHAGASGAEFRTLRDIAIAAEIRMLRATEGVNTHRGAIFHIGLLAAAAGWRGQRDRARPQTLGSIVRQRWGGDIARHGRRANAHGARASEQYGVGGALAEAAAGFPSVYGLALPAFRMAFSRTGSVNRARVQAFFSLMATLDDTNLLHRGGAAGLEFARAGAASFLDDGGVLASDWLGRTVAMHRTFRERWLSPGGSADLLAACLFVHGMEG